MHPALVKKSGLAGIKRAVPMPMPSLINNPKAEIKAILQKRAEMYKPL